MADNTVVERLFSPLPDVVFCLKNKERIYVSANDAFATRLGLGSRWEVVGKRADDLFPPALADHYRAQDEEVLAGGDGFWDRMELVTAKASGTGWFLATKIPVKDRNGEVIGLASISRDLRVPSGREQGFSGLAKVIQHIEQHYHEDIDRQKLCQLARLTEPQLERRMKKIFTISLSGFIRKHRIENGARLLTTSDMTLADISLACGYSEQSAFTRQFKSSVGMPPGRYRKEYAGWW